MCMVIALGFFNPAWWAPLMVVTILVGIGLFWLALWQLWSEAKPTPHGAAHERRSRLPPGDGTGRRRPSPQEVIVVSEKQGPPVG